MLNVNDEPISPEITETMRRAESHDADNRSLVQPAVLPLLVAVTLFVGTEPMPASAKSFARYGAPTQAQLGELAIQRRTKSSLNDPVFGAESVRTYPFPAKGGDLDPNVFWQVTGHSSGNKRDLTATRFNPETGKWTANHPNTAGLSNEEKRLIWNTPVYAPATGIVLTCWRNAPDGDDPGEDGCGNNGDANSLCRTPGGGNHVRIWIPEERRMILLAHFREGTVPEHLCPHDAAHVTDWEDKSGAFGFNPDILVPFPFRWVQEGDYIGRVGNSGRSGGPHLHVQMRECELPLHLDTCEMLPLPFHGADVAQKPIGRNVRDDDWVALNGTLSVTSPRQMVRPDEVVDDFIQKPRFGCLSLAQSFRPGMSASCVRGPPLLSGASDSNQHVRGRSGCLPWEADSGTQLSLQGGRLTDSYNGSSADD